MRSFLLCRQHLVEKRKILRFDKTMQIVKNHVFFIRYLNISLTTGAKKRQKDLNP